MKQYLENFSEKLYAHLQNQEELGLFLHSEESQFLRFSRSLVRQNTSVHQHELAAQLNDQKRTYRFRFNLTLDLQQDLATALHLLNDARALLQKMDPHPQYLPLKNHGRSEVIRKSHRPADNEIPQIIHHTFKDCDLAGLWCSGPLRQASMNSKGQFHYFETDSFFFDYSIYDGPKAAKGYYSAEQFSLDEFHAQAATVKNKLSLLQRPLQSISKGQYDVYLEPMAVAEIMGSMSWSSLSQSSFNKGHAPLKKLKDQELSLSKQFSIQENFAMGFSPLFNSIGELSPEKVSLIEEGRLVSLLTSSATAEEYKLESNFADPSEFPRSLEVRAGTLKESEVLKKLHRGLYLSNLHYINYSDVQTARLTGMTRFASFWVENGEIVGPIQDLRFDESLYNIFGKNLVELTDASSIFVSTSTYGRRDLGALKVPGALIKNFNFTL